MSNSGGHAHKKVLADKLEIIHTKDGSLIIDERHPQRI
jgi:hypothetical protein